ncbi:GNAT family N-acetyltransferase (plasmid) [Photobacterium sp. DA100]|uniref:GNAT family N-acetyltransferase n=1 Tax=Photobacterium sp. DA100 TaxID=3027472 RepID=UPI002479FCF3|nr:GNAT family N-acetyltransferase [Photobacterium sp. DA100]WEM45611.1 GNAT family N-acetyltransferase [Photobacterium sp. DA100]
MNMILDVSPSIKTQRLYTRPWDEDDLAGLYRIMSNQSVHTFTEEEPWSEEKARHELKKYHVESSMLDGRRGYFNCPLILSGCDTLIGRVGLHPYGDNDSTAEIEWVICEDHWHQGYATEIGRAILEYGFREAGFHSIIGFTCIRNMSARQVMKKIGMEHIGDRELHNRKLSVFQIKREP